MQCKVRLKPFRATHKKMRDWKSLPRNEATARWRLGTSFSHESQRWKTDWLVIDFLVFFGWKRSIYGLSTWDVCKLCGWQLVMKLQHSTASPSPSMSPHPLHDSNLDRLLPFQSSDRYVPFGGKDRILGQFRGISIVLIFWSLFFRESWPKSLNENIFVFWFHWKVNQILPEKSKLMGRLRIVNCISYQIVRKKYFSFLFISFTFLSLFSALLEIVGKYFSRNIWLVNLIVLIFFCFLWFKTIEKFFGLGFSLLGGLKNNHITSLVLEKIFVFCETCVMSISDWLSKYNASGKPSKSDFFLESEATQTL